MKEISKFSDLEIEVIFKDKTTGEEIPVPICDFELQYFVYTDKVRSAKQVGGTLSDNCKIKDGRLHIFFDTPDFGCGVLKARHIIHIPNPDFPDTIRTAVREGALDVLVVGHPCEYTDDPVVVNDIIVENLTFVTLLSAEDSNCIITEDGYKIKLEENNGRN